MRQLLTVGVRARFPLQRINDLWSEFYRQLAEKPAENLFYVGTHTDYRNLRSKKVWVKIDEYPDEKVATMLFADEY